RMGWLDMSEMDHTLHRSAYLVVLGANDASPLTPPPSDEPPRNVAEMPAQMPAHAPPPNAARPAGPARAAAASAGASHVQIDIAGIENRIVPLGIPGAEYTSLVPGSAGTFFYLERRPQPSIGPPPQQLWEYVLAAQKPM